MVFRSLNTVSVLDLGPEYTASLKVKRLRRKKEEIIQNMLCVLSKFANFNYIWLLRRIIWTQRPETEHISNYWSGA